MSAKYSKEREKRREYNALMEEQRQRNASFELEKEKEKTKYLNTREAVRQERAKQRELKYKPVAEKFALLQKTAQNIKKNADNKKVIEKKNLKYLRKKGKTQEELKAPNVWELGRGSEAFQLGKGINTESKGAEAFQLGRPDKKKGKRGSQSPFVR